MYQQVENLASTAANVAVCRLLGRTRDKSGSDLSGCALPVVVELCVAWLGIRVAIVHIVAGVRVLTKPKGGGGGRETS